MLLDEHQTYFSKKLLSSRTRELVAKKLSLTTTYRFEIIDEEYIEELKGKIEKARSYLQERLRKVGE